MMPHQANLLTLLNGLANSILVVSALHLLIRVFGHPDSAIWKKPYAAALCKLATTITVCGAVSNVMTFSTPVWTEIVLNVGVSLNFLWLSFYTTKPEEKVIKRKSNSRNRAAKSSRSR